MMSQVAPVDIEFCVIVHMNEFMHHGVFHVFLAEKPALAHNDGTRVWMKTASARVVAGHAEDVFF